MVLLNYRDARPIYTQIADGFRDQILGGILQPDDRLPSVRDLAAQLTINPNTIQRAYRELEVQGWIATIPGKGCFVQGIPQRTPQEQQEALTAFDKATATLLAMGFTPGQLAERLTQGGDRDA